MVEKLKSVINIIYMRYKVLDLAECIITLSAKKGNYLSLQELQFILYLAQVKYLRDFNNIIFKEDIYVNKYSFDIVEVSKRFGGFGSSKILLDFPNSINKIKLHVQDMLNSILDKYANMESYDFLKESAIFRRASELNILNNFLVSPSDIRLVETIEI